MPEGTTLPLSNKLGLIVRGLLSPLLMSVDVSIEPEGGSSISGGIGRVVTIWVTDLQKNFSSR